MKFCMSTGVGTWTYCSTFEPNPDHSPDAGTGKPKSRRSVEVGQTGTSLSAGYKAKFLSKVRGLWVLQPESNYSFNVEKRSISECLCSLLAPLVCISFFPALKFLTSLIFLIAINSLTRWLTC